MSDPLGEFAGDNPELQAYLQTFLDETEEQLEDLVETMLSLERDPSQTQEINEAFRLIHSIKGSAGMLGLDNITVLTHHLENRFERFRSGQSELDEGTMNLVLKCIDFLRHCLDRLRQNEPLASPADLLAELKELEAAPAESPADSESEPPTVPAEPTPQPRVTVPTGAICIVVKFRPGLPLVDLKARLIVSRLTSLVELERTVPALDALADDTELAQFELYLATAADPDALRAAADVEGVEEITIEGALPATDAEDSATTERAAPESESESELPAEASTMDAPADSEDNRDDETTADPPGNATPADDSGVPVDAEEPQGQVPAGEDAESKSPDPTGSPAAPTTSPTSLTKSSSDTMRVDIDRLDSLMNLIGELVVNRARLAQIAQQIAPALRQTSAVHQLREFATQLAATASELDQVPGAGDWNVRAHQLREGLAVLHSQLTDWEGSRKSLGQMSEAIDQLTRVTGNLQQGVMETRMVPVGPLFNRFQRVIRDLSKERGKQVHLQLRGEGTELDKRMIDELGDPLVHLVRNSIDHGLEQPDVREERGKPAAGTIYLEASHSGNNVQILLRDDGQGIDVEKIKARLIDRAWLDPEQAAALSDEQALDYIWQPGFSTAAQVTDVSGRGVGMDAVRSRIQAINGTVEVSSTPLQGTTFTIRLPLTLAIINSLLVRRGDVMFSIPIDDVREIVSIQLTDVVTIGERRTCEVRDEFILLTNLGDLFHWHGMDYGYQPLVPTNTSAPDATSAETKQVVILQSGGQTLGLEVDELLGNQDVVIKSLADNFVNIRGLSGASILGDGQVCLMLDVGTLIAMATKSLRTIAAEETRS